MLKKGAELFLVFDPISIKGDGTLISAPSVKMPSDCGGVHRSSHRYRERKMKRKAEGLLSTGAASP